jgi:hypothetical protein
MKNQLPRILSNMQGVSSAIIRYRKENAVYSKIVEVTDHYQSKIICCLQQGDILSSDNQLVSLIIKNKLHYLHCTGKLCRSFLNGRLVTLELIKTSLFIRKKNKDTSWMEELYQFVEPVEAY